MLLVQPYFFKFKSTIEPLNPLNHQIIIFKRTNPVMLNVINRSNPWTMALTVHVKLMKLIKRWPHLC